MLVANILKHFIVEHHVTLFSTHLVDHFHHLNLRDDYARK